MKKLFSFICGVVCMCIVLMPLKTEAAGKIVQSASGKTTADISWTKEAGENFYDVYIWMPSSYWEGNKLYTNYSLEYLGETAQTQFHFTNLSGGESYSIVLRSYDADGDFVKDTEGVIETLPDQTIIEQTILKWSSYSSQNQKTKMTFNLYVDFISQDSADGYEIVLCDKKGKTVKKVKIKAEKSSIQRYTFYNLKESYYTVKGRAYKKFKGKTYYGVWSQKSYALRQPQCAAKPTSKELFIRWETIPGVTGYDIYMNTKKTGEYTKVASADAKKTMISVKKFKNKAFEKGKTYYYYVVAKKKSGKMVYESTLSYRFKVVIK